MKEIIVNHQNSKKEIIVLDNGKVVEQYVEKDNEKMIEGNIYLGKVINVLPGMQAAFVDIGEGRNAYFHIKDILPKTSNITGNKNEKLNSKDISKYVKIGSSVLVQVKKDKTINKGARISKDLNFPGKFIAMIPTSGFITISQKIEDVEECKRLKKIIEDNSNPDHSYIIRTAACGKSAEEIIKDIKEVEDAFGKMKEKEAIATKNQEIPCKLYDAGGVVKRIILGLIEDTDNVIVNDKEMFEQIKDMIPGIVEKIVFKDVETLIDADILNQLEKINNRKVWLKCGGFITIDKTEALTAIDVNTGKYTGKDSVQKTIFKVNEEATIEIAKQLRARDIGGIIIIDYIDMEDKQDEENIIKIFTEELKKDRAKIQLVGFTPLHLLELTRKHLCSN